MVKNKDLKKFEIFSVFSEKQREELSKITEKKTYQMSKQVYQSGDRAKQLFVVTKGLVSLRELKPGDEIGIGLENLERGDIFGCASFLKPQKYTLTAVCEEDSEVLAIDADQLIELCELDPEIGYKFMKKIAQIYFERYEVAKRQIHEMVKTPTLITALPG